MSEASAAASAGKQTISEFVKVACEYFAPFAGVVTGFFVGGSALGGINAVYNLLNGASSKLAGSAGRIAGAVMALIWGVVGGMFWHMRGRGGIWMQAIGGFLGGFFWGAAVQDATQIWNPRTASNGLLDNLSSWTQSLATGG